MPFDVTMPKLTDSMEEGRIVEWRVAAGDRVREGDVLAEIETDKAVMELESFRSGTVADLVRQAGDVVAVGEVIARIDQGGEAAIPAQGVRPAPEQGKAAEEPVAETPPPAPEAVPAEPAAPPAPGAEASPPAEPGSVEPAKAEAEPAVPLPGAHPLAERGGKHSPRPAPPAPPKGEAGQAADGAAGVRASPRARKLARERGVDLAALHGTGPEGRITAADVEGAPPGAVASERPAAGRADEELPAVTFAEGEAEVEPVSFYQQAVIRRVVASKHVIPHFYVNRTVRAEALLARKEAEREASGASLTHLLLRAAVLALEDFPEANRSYDRGRWIRWKVVNLGLAVQTEAGLAVAVLRGAQGKDLGWLSAGARDLVERARAGKLRPEERRNATFTLSNLGAYDAESFGAIINPPSAMTLAVGSAVDAPVAIEGRVEVGKVLHLTLSCDHRVVDGVLGARFLARLGQTLEQPERF